MEDSQNIQPNNALPSSGAAKVSPFYHEVKNEVIRPDRAITISRYFMEKWMPRLGSTATCIVMYLRSLGGELRLGEMAIQVSQKEIATAAQCSVRTLQRELADNPWLTQFVRMEERFIRGEAGHVRQIENIYHIAMDDPLVPEDEPVVAELLVQRSAYKPSGRVILTEQDVVRQNDVQPRDSVVRQNDALRGSALYDKMSYRFRYDILSYQDSETNNNSNVSETRLRGNSGTDSNDKSLEEKARSIARKHTSGNPSQPLQQPEDASKSKHTSGKGASADGDRIGAWRQKNEELARCSAQELDDMRSLGYHIRVWNHARKTDSQHGNSEIEEGIFYILRDLSDRRKQSGQPQGKAWTLRTRKWFNEMGSPLLVQNDMAELEEVRAALADAPFLDTVADTS